MMRNKLMMIIPGCFLKNQTHSSRPHITLLVFFLLFYCVYVCTYV